MPPWLGMADLTITTSINSPPSVGDVSVHRWWAANSRRTTVLMSSSSSAQLMVTEGLGRSVFGSSGVLEGPCSDAIAGRVQV